MWTQHDKATANLTIDGLAICCFNSEAEPGYWQIAFLRQPDHRLTITIDPGDGGKLNRIKVGESASRIEIKTIKGRTPNYDTYPRGFYDKGKLKGNRKKKPGSQDAAENFRWALDLQDETDVKHGEVQLKRPEHYGVTLASIHDAIFYTCNQTSSNLYMVPAGVDPNLWPQKLKGWELGMTNDQLGADIECEDDGGIIILVDGDEKARLNSRPGGKPWQICLMNMRPHDKDGHGKMGGHGKTAARGRDVLEPGDFQFYYDAIETSDGHFVIWGYPSRWAARARRRDCGEGHVKSGRTDCDTVWLGGDITSLEPLLPGGSKRKGSARRA